MHALFRYNWLVRDEWFTLCEKIPTGELRTQRTGGAGSILYTLFHIIDVEYSWIRGIQGKEDIPVKYEDDTTLEHVKQLSDTWRAEIQQFLCTWSDEWEHERITVPWSAETHAKGEILRHVIAHEIHHMGQLSIWVREIGYQPVSANVIERGLFG